LQNPSHSENEQPFTAFQVDNNTTGRNGNNPLSFKWIYGGQSGVPWKSLSSPGTNQGSSNSYQYTNPQAYDIAPGNAFIRVGDSIKLTALACGCSLGGHEGHVWLDSVGTTIPQSLWVSAAGPVSSTSGSHITYTYTYINNSASVANNVQVIASMPALNLGGQLTTFVSSSNPTTGTGTPSCTGGVIGTTNPVTCSMGTLQPGESGTFNITVNIPSGWPSSSGPVNNGNYPISATGVSPVLGPLVQTQLLAPSSLSNLVANVSGMPNTGELGQAYSGTFTCSNVPTATATADASNASCEISNLPTGLSQGACTISPGNTSWTQPSTIPTGETVTCAVNGTPTSTGTITALVSTDASNNSNSTDNVKAVPITVINSPSIPATLNGSSILNPAVVCCGRPVILGDLPVAVPGPTIYTVTNKTGNVSCFIGQSGNQAFLKVNGRNGSCTIVGNKSGIISTPLTIVAP
jgi:Domain of unknown function DUF11